MNQFYYETRGKEKVKELLNEGQRSQASSRSGAPKLPPVRGLPRLILGILGILGLIGLLAH